MNIKIENRMESCQDGCRYADIYTDVKEVKNGIGDLMMATVEIYCEHESVCRFIEE